MKGSSVKWSLDEFTFRFLHWPSIMKHWKCAALNVQFNASFAKYNISFFSITVDHVTSQQLTMKIFHIMGMFFLAPTGARWEAMFVDNRVKTRPNLSLINCNLKPKQGKLKKADPHYFWFRWGFLTFQLPQEPRYLYLLKNSLSRPPFRRQNRLFSQTLTSSFWSYLSLICNQISQWWVSPEVRC